MLKLSDRELVSKTKCLVREERTVGLQVLEYLREIERRRVYAAVGYSSLFIFCIQELGYSEPQAQLRIDAMRAIRDNPEILEDVRSAAIHVTTLAKVRRFLRAKAQKTGKDYLPEERLALYRRMKGKGSREVDRELMTISPESARVDESVRVVSKDLIELRLVIPESLREQLVLLQDIYSHRMMNSNSFIELIQLLAADAMKRHWKHYPTKELRIYQSK